MDVGNRHKKRRMIALDIKKIKEDLTLPCGCSRRCNSKFNEFDILEQRKRYHKAKKGIHQQLLSLELFKSSIYSDNGKTVHFVHGQLVCKEFWYLTVLHISRATYHRIKYYASSGIHAFTEPLKKGAIGEKGKIAVGFMQLYISLHGDPCPEEDKVILARGIGIKDAYVEYSRTYSSEYIVKLPRFYQLWGEHFPNVSQRKYSNFTKCNICVLTRHLLSQNLTPEREALVKHDRDEHLKRQRIERELYYNRRAQAVMYPNDKASVILDAMDQSKTNLPNFGADTPKGFDPARRLQTHLIGGILHGRRTYFLLDILQWPHDSNLTISCFLYCLSEEFKDQTRPKTLYVQLDNCCRENKNKYFIGMMALLVKWGFFKEITMNFLMVGHTHEDIDARFSRVSQSLKKKPPKTLTALINELSGCLKGDKSPKVEMVSSVYNFKEWLTPVLNDIHDHTFPHSYRFTIDKPGHVALHYKAWSNDDEWLPKQHDNPLEIFKIDHTTGQQYEPTLTPALVEPDFNRKQQLQDIQSNIEKNMAFFSITEAEWWKMFFKNPKDVSSKPVPWFLDTLNCDAENDVLPVVVDPNCSSPLSIYMEKERATPQVYTGKRHKTTTKTPNETEQAISYSHPVDLGYMVAFIEDGEFGIGEVMKVQGDKLLIKLYNGDLNRQWTPCAINGTEFSTNIQKASILEWGVFLLTKGKCLPSCVKNELKNILK